LSGIGFVVLAHENPAHLARLARRLHPGRVFLHLDARRDLRPFAPVLALPHVSGVERVPICWAGFSIVDATMNLVRAALADAAVEHIVLLSGACYPIRPVERLSEFLAAGDGCHVAALPLSCEATPDLMRAIEHRYFFDWDRFPAGIMARRAARVACDRVLPKRGGPPGGLVPHFGSQWWAMSRPCARLVLDHYETDAALVRYYRRAMAPDEHFVQTIVANSAYGRTAPTAAYRGSDSFGEAPLHHIRLTMDESSARQGSKPAWVDVATELDLLRSSGKFFVRKIRHAHQTDLIDRELLGVDARSGGPR